MNKTTTSSTTMSPTGMVKPLLIVSVRIRLLFSIILIGVADVNVEDVPATSVAAEGTANVANDGVPAAVEEPFIPSPTPPTQPPPPSQDIPSTSQDVEILMDLFRTLLETCKTLTTTTITRYTFHLPRGIIELIDADEDITLKDVTAIAKDVKDAEIEESAYDDDIEPAELKEVVEVVTTAKLITKVVTVASATITAAALILTTAAALKLTTAPRQGKRIMVHEPKPLKKKNQIEHDEAYARELETELNKNIDWDEQMEEEDNKALKIISGSQEDKAPKRQKLDEEIEELRKHLQIVPNKDDDVYTEATPLALKVPVVDYEIYTENNKPYYKIKRADSSHQLYLSFLSMLRNFVREDLEVL
nr:hypothetical protein [Tanacetum cinerariifolium]